MIKSWWRRLDHCNAIEHALRWGLANSRWALISSRWHVQVTSPLTEFNTIKRENTQDSRARVQQDVLDWVEQVLVMRLVGGRKILEKSNTICSNRNLLTRPLSWNDPLKKLRCMCVMKLPGFRFCFFRSVSARIICRLLQFNRRYFDHATTCHLRGGATPERIDLRSDGDFVAAALKKAARHESLPTIDKRNNDTAAMFRIVHR